MKNQLQGITLSLFGVILMLVAVVDPSLPLLESALTPISFVAGLGCGVAGIVFAFRKEE